jgi:glycosyltransferase involved in cell wall biosynthesis
MDPDDGVAVVIPTYNEAESIGGVLMALPRELVRRVIVADGGSTDHTVRIARDLGAEIIDAGKGYGRACLLGAEAAEDCGILVFMDGDGADDAGAICALVSPIRDNQYEFVIASRSRGQREPGSMAGHQIAAGFAVGALIKVLYGVRYTDMCAYRAIRRPTLLALGMREMTYGWNLEMQLRVARAGLRVLELPVTYRRRTGGKSKVAGNFSGSIKAGLRIIATFARVATEGAPAGISLS